MDVLSDILENLSLRSTVFAQTELAAPWGLLAAPRPELAFHVISRGHCWFQVEDEPMVEVASGDVLLLAPDRAHSLRDHPTTSPRPVRELVAAGALGASANNPGRRTQIICGFFQIDDAGGELLRSALPRVIHTRDAASDRDPWIAQTLRLLALESAGTQPGRSTVVNRLCEALFVYVLRDHLAMSSAEESGWMRGLLDPHVSRALELMHEAPDHEWTVASLAARVGMSRSAFAAHFQALVTETPMRYLAKWRMHKAASALRTGELAIANIATQAGYDSVAAFSKAFKRTVGVAPGAYRRRSSTADVALVADE